MGIPVGPETGYQLTAELVARHWGPRTRGVLVANPGNPTGTLIASQELAAIHAEARARDGRLIVDEIYHELVYDTSPPSAANLGEDVLVLNSFSKYFLMTGWRLGWMLIPEMLLPSIDKLAQNIFLSAPTMSQHAALVALAADTRVLLDQRKAELQHRRDALLPELARLGFEVKVAPQGAFYCYADVSRFGMSSEALCERLLLDAGVAITPGTDFGSHGANHNVRFAYTTSLARIQEAVRRIEVMLG